jgi:prepilin-type processing-associated H-X9-DG protein
LVELLVVIGIIALLISILLPALTKARESANTIKCAANLRAIGQGISVYAAEWKQCYPAAYLYDGQSMNQGDGRAQDDANGYVQLSYILYGDSSGGGTAKTPVGVAGVKAFTCPSHLEGGLPPTNPQPGDAYPGVSIDNPAVIDKQAPRLAYTFNEAVICRNKFYVGFGSPPAVRRCQFVRAGSVKNSGNTILATEWTDDATLVADTGRVDPNAIVCKSHRPVNGYSAISGGAVNMPDLPPARVGAAYRWADVSDLNDDPTSGGASNTRLDWVGRIHGGGKKSERKTNFLYCDGHVETKHIRDTLRPTFQWGEKCYSVEPNEDVVTY